MTVTGNSFKMLVERHTNGPCIDDERIFRLRTTGEQPLCLQPRLIDLFCGAGGMTAGFSPFFGHGFQPVWANDSDASAAATYNLNFGPHCFVGDISEILLDPNTYVPHADVVIGGPPCQGFSLLNKFKSGDSRTRLWTPFMEVVRRSGAAIFVMENVPELLRSPEWPHIRDTAHSLGFTLAHGRLCAADYGAPQLRWRAFIMGCNFIDPASAFPPKRTHVSLELAPRRRFLEPDAQLITDPRPYRTVRDAIGDLPPPTPAEKRSNAPPLDLHFGRNPTEISKARYRAVPDEGMNRFDLLRRAPELTPPCWVKKKKGGADLFGRLWWDKPSVTIRTEFFKPEKGRYLHPEQHRPITHREAARLQGFPDEFFFVGSKAQIARQIGNAVPCELAARVADSVYALLAARVGDEHW